MICILKAIDYVLCLEIYELVDPSRFLTAPVLAWQVAIKRLK